MKRAASITIGVILAGLVTGCSDSEQSDYSEVCVDREMTILPEDQCDDDGDRASGHGFIYVPGSAHVGAHGTRYTSSYTSVRPTSGTIGRVPASGGFGTHAGTAGT